MEAAHLPSPLLLPPLPGVRWGAGLAVKRLLVFKSVNLCCTVDGWCREDRRVVSTRGVEGGGARLKDTKGQY